MTATGLRQAAMSGLLIEATPFEISDLDTAVRHLHLVLVDEQRVAVALVTLAAVSGATVDALIAEADLVVAPPTS
jgi:hypothetical protein